MEVPQCGLLQGQPSSPSFHTNQAYLLIGCPLEQWIGCSCQNNTCLVNVLSSNNICRNTLQQGNCHIQVCAGMCNFSTVRDASVVAFKVDGISVVH